MASYQKRGDAWRAIVRRKGQTVTGTFDTKAQAEEWARKQRVREQAIASIGSLRDLPPLGL